jgi:DNA polymerase epsilon subunit 2
MIIFMGNFTGSHESMDKNINNLTEGFEKLTDLILSFPNLPTSYFIFIPGPSDPGNTVVNVLPKSPIPAVLTEYITSKLDNVFFVSNPCRCLPSCF